MADKLFRILGRVIDKQTHRGVRALRVEAWDKDLLVNDMVGSTFTDAWGRFRMVFDSSAFREFIFDQIPDVFFKVYRRNRLILETRNTLLWRPRETLKQVQLEVELPAEEPGEPGYPDPNQPWDPDGAVGEVPGETYHPPQPGQWTEDIADWWRQRQAEKPPHDPVVPMPRSWLDCTSNFGPQILAQTRNQPASVHFPVWNDGNFPSWTCYVQVWEGPGGYTHPLRDYQLRGQAIIALQPGERREVTVPWMRTLITGRIVGIVYDPLLDPIDFQVVEQYNRHITSIHYINLE